MRPLILLLVITLSVLQLGMRSSDLEAERDHLDRVPDIYYLPSGAILKFAALDYEELLADLVWVKSVLYFAEQLVDKGDYRHLESILNTVIDLDPRFAEAYIWAGSAFIYNGRLITTESIRKSNAILKRGWDFYQESLIKWKVPSNFWRVPFMIGFNYEVELRERGKGLDYLREAARFDNVPKHIRTWAATMYRRRGKEAEALDVLYDQLTLEALYGHLKLVYSEQQREEILARIKRIYALDEQRRFDAKTIEELQQRRSLAYEIYLRDFDYLPFTFFELIYEDGSSYNPLKRDHS